MSETIQATSATTLPSVGSTPFNNNIFDAQSALSDLGYTVRPTGVMDRDTQRALAAYEQKTFATSSNGGLTTSTLASLKQKSAIIEVGNNAGDLLTTQGAVAEIASNVARNADDIAFQSMHSNVAGAAGLAVDLATSAHKIGNAAPGELSNTVLEEGACHVGTQIGSHFGRVAGMSTGAPAVVLAPLGSALGGKVGCEVGKAAVEVGRELGAPLGDKIFYLLHPTQGW